MKKWSLPLGLLFGVLAAVMVFVYLQDLERKKSAPPPPKVGVVVAKADIPSGARLTPDMVTLRQVLVEAKHSQAAQSVGEVSDKLTLYPLVKDEQVLASRLADKPKASNLAGVVPAGRRAVAVAATDVVGAGGLIQPGDRVDVLVVFENREGTKVTSVATLALENIEVLAVDREVNGLEKETLLQAAADAKKASAAPASPAMAARTVTLAVTPEEAQRLMLADRSGTLRLALRAKGDDGKATITDTDSHTLAKVQ